MLIYDLFQEEDFYKVLPLKVYNELSKDDQSQVKEHFIHQSNLIEGISYSPYGYTISSEEWGRIQKEGPLPVPVPVWDNHVKALDYVFDCYSSAPLNNISIRETHKILTTDFPNIPKPGQYRKVSVNLVNSSTREVIRTCPSHEKISQLMRSYFKDLERLEQSDSVTRERLLFNHAYYEWIHPHIDGNGRNGRLALLWNSLRNLDEIILITSSQREPYYWYLQSLEKHFNERHKRLLK